MAFGDVKRVVDGALRRRISRDPEGLRLGVERQRDDSERFAEQVRAVAGAATR